MKKRELADVRQNAEGLIYTTEKSIEEYGHVLDEDDKGDIETYLVTLRGMLASDDVEALREAIQDLESVSHKMAEAMYAEAAEALEE